MSLHAVNLSIIQQMRGKELISYSVGFWFWTSDTWIPGRVEEVWGYFTDLLIAPWDVVWAIGGVIRDPADERVALCDSLFQRDVWK